MDLKTQFLSLVKKQFPDLEKSLQQSLQQKPAPISLDSLVSPELLSPACVKLPFDILNQAKKFVHSAFTLRQLPSYQKHYADPLAQLQLPAVSNHSILMSYDFHVDENAQLQLIEINTNASFLALSGFLYQMQQLPLPIADFSMQQIRADILNELALNGKSPGPDFKIAIVDEDPPSQRLFIEFLIYAEYFKSWGWQCEIRDYREDLQSFDFIYNRHTDFLLKNPDAAPMRELLKQGQTTISPQPFEYFYLADKARMLDWSQPGFLAGLGLDSQHIATLQAHLPACWLLNLQSAEQLWSERKNLFFKPLQSFGAKQTYRGDKISRKTFAEISAQDFLAQKFIPPAEWTVETPQGPQRFKYDLRFYAYEDRVESVVARLYQGQVTNLKTPFGGFCPIQVVV